MSLTFAVVVVVDFIFDFMTLFLHLSFFFAHSLIQCWARRQASRHRKQNVRTRVRNVFTQILNSWCFTFDFNFLTNLYIWTLDVASILHETWSCSTSSIIVVADNSETQFFFFFAITCSRLASRRRQRHTPKTNAKWKERNIHSFIDSVLRLWIALTPHSHLRIDECAREEFSSSSFECSFHSPLLASSSSPHREERKQARMYGVLKNRSFHFISNINRLGSIKSEWHDATTWATSGECLGEKELNHLIYITLSFMCTTLGALLWYVALFRCELIYTFTQWARLYECFFYFVLQYWANTHGELITIELRYTHRDITTMASAFTC